MRAPPPVEPWPITATIKHFKELAGIGSTTVYELIKSGEIRSVTIGRRRLIVMESYRELLECRAMAELTHDVVSEPKRREPLPPRPAKPLSERFEGRYEIDPNSGCWVWASPTDKDGYGILPAKSGNKRAHRISYELNVGAIPPGLLVCHHCDNPSCVNPKHLYVGTQADNMRDVATRGRRTKAKPAS